MANSNYNVVIKEAKGDCDSDLFKKIARNGDVNAVGVKELIGKVIKIKGYANVEITAGDKNFSTTYYAVEDGYFQSGSEVLLNSIKNYLEDTDTFKIVEVKTKKGTTYKATPIVTKEETTDDLPF